MKTQVSNNQYMKVIRQWKVTFHRRDELDVVKYFTCNKFDLFKSIKQINEKYRGEGYVGVHNTIEVVVAAPKPLTSLFLEKDKREALCSLLKSVKAKYKSYDKQDVKRARLRDFSVGMWNSLQNEFYMSADVCWNSIWKFQDAFEQLDSCGYLLVGEPVKLDAWTEKLKINYHRDWTIEVLKLIKDFNLDSQPECYVAAFMDDFMAVKNHQQFCGVLLKWTDLIRWSPYKLSLLDDTYMQPKSVHYEDEYNPDVDSDYILD